MTFGEYLLGAALFVVILGGACVVSVAAVRRRRPELAGAERALAHGTVITAALLAAYMVPGILGILNRWTPAAAAVLLAIASRAIPRHPSPPSAPRAAPAAAEGTLDRIVAALAVLAAGAAAIAYVAAHATTPVEQVDQVTFHLPVVARWIQTGSLWGVHHFVPYYGVGNYPHTGDVLSLAAVSPWRYDSFVRLTELPYFALAGIAVYALARRLSAPPAASAVFGAVFVSIPVVLWPSVAFALPDALLFAMIGAGLVFLARSDYVLAGLAFGLAFGAKWYGVSAVIAVLALWVVASLAGRRPPRAIVRAAAVVATVLLATGGFWLVRNVVGSDSPFAPAGWLPFGAHPDDEFARSIGLGPIDYTVAHYAFDLHVWRHYLSSELYSAFRLPGVLLLAAVPAAIGALAVEWRRGRVEHRALLALVLALLLALVYAITPASAQGLEGAPVLALANARYLVPAAVPAAALAAWLCGRLGRWALLAEIAGLVAVVDGTHHALHFGWAGFAAAFSALSAAAVLVYLSRHASRSALVGAAAAAALVVIVGGQLLQRHYARHRFGRLDPAVTWVQAFAPRGARIGVTGAWASAGPSPVYAAFGPRLRNRVEYVGLLRDGRLSRYGSRAAFVSGLDKTRDDLLIVGMGEPPREHVVEQDWARAAGYVPVTRSRWLQLFRRHGLSLGEGWRDATGVALQTPPVWHP